MKMRQLVQMTPTGVYCGWSGTIQFNDNNGDEITVELTDKQIIQLAKSLSDKVEKIYRDRYEEAKENLDKLVEEC